MNGDKNVSKVSLSRFGVRSRSQLTALLIAVVMLPACNADSTSPDGLVANETKGHATERSEAEAQLVARGIALALQDPDARAHLRRDLSVSPFPYRSVHLRSYLMGADGRPLAIAAAKALGISSSRFDDVLTRLSDLALGIPSRGDRTFWSGSSDIIVVGTTKSAEQLRATSQLVGFETSGATREINPSAGRVEPVLVFSQVPFSFGSNPESKRLRTPRAFNVTDPITMKGNLGGVRLYTCEDRPDQPMCQVPDP